MRRGSQAGFFQFYKPGENKRASASRNFAGNERPSTSAKVMIGIRFIKAHAG
jgi:hypothetical protein